MMMDLKAIKKVAHLARLDISDERANELTQELSTIMNYVEKLNELDLDDVKPMAHAIEVSNVFRKDEVIASDVVDDILKQAPEASAPFFKVPKVL